MKKTLILAVLTIAAVGCDTLPKSSSVKGTYVLVGKLEPYHYTKKIEFTTTKSTIDTFFGKISYDYKIEDGYVFIGSPEMILRYEMRGSDTLVNDTNIGYEGTYVRRD